MEHFVVCSRGCRHWGAHGAAGLLLRGPGERFLLVQRGWRTHQGGTWSVPGGAALLGEDPFAAAMREAVEELGALPSVTPVREHRDDHGGWAYVTVVADVPHEFAPAELGWETADYRWVTAPEATELPLHPGLRDAWSMLTTDAGGSGSQVA